MAKRKTSDEECSHAMQLVRLTIHICYFVCVEGERLVESRGLVEHCCVRAQIISEGPARACMRFRLDFSGELTAHSCYASRVEVQYRINQ